MLRSMNSAISGLKVHQLFMDVIGNNIANVNTTGFKGSRTTFESMLAQTLRGAQAPSAQRAGLNPQQIGLGAIMASVDVVNTQGALTTTSKTTDLAIQGDGMFVVTDGGKKYYTRDGAFDLGADATLVSSATGMKVMGWTASTDATGQVTINTGVPPTGPITIPTGQAATARVSRTVGFNGNLNGAATESMGSGVVESSTLAADGTIGADIAATDTITFTYDGQTVTTAGLTAATANTTTLANTATNIASAMNAALVAAHVVPAGSAPIVVTAVDTAGVAGEGTFSFQAPKALAFGNSASTNNQLNTALRNRKSSGLDSATTTMTVYDSLGTAHEIPVRFDKVTTDATGAPVVGTWKWTLAGLPPDTRIDGAAGNGQGTGYIKFDSGGRFQSVNTLDASNAVAKASQAGMRLNFTNGAANGQDVVLDFSQMTQLQGDNTATAYANDGYPTGTLTGFVVGPDGVVTGSFSNGVSQAIGQIALATFPNAGGLVQAGQSLFTESPNSGTATIGTAGSGSRGQINAGQLEMSNVDLASQFTDMIRAERGFQANSRIITTSDEMLQDLVNLKR